MNLNIRLATCFALALPILTACNNKLETTTTEVDPIVQNTENVISNAVPAITVYKSPTCGCCTGWVTYLEDEGFAVTAIDHDDVDSIKAEHGLHDPALKSCHTALVDGYVVEGHVPVNDILRLLREKPKDVVGITAPGMPMMSPGMGSLTPKDYSVLSFTKSGETTVYSQY